MCAEPARNGGVDETALGAIPAGDQRVQDGPHHRQVHRFVVIEPLLLDVHSHLMLA